MEPDQVAKQNARSLEYLDGLYVAGNFEQLADTLHDTGPAAIRRLTLAAIRRHSVIGVSDPEITLHSRKSVKLLESLIKVNLVFGGYDLEASMDIMGEWSQRAVLINSIVRYNMVDVPTINGTQPQLVAVGSM